MKIKSVKEVMCYKYLYNTTSNIYEGYWRKKTMNKYLFPILFFVLLLVQPMSALSNTIRNQQVTPDTRNIFVEESPVISNQQTWMKIYGGMASDEASAIYQTNDGGYIIVGTTYSFGSGIGRNAWLLKLDPNGNEEWNKTYGGFYTEVGNHVQQTSDGGYILIGWTDSFNGSFNDNNIFLVKTDANGVEQWHRTYGGPDHDSGYYVLGTEDGGYLLLGSTHSYGEGSTDIWLVKTDSQGMELWNKTIGTSDDEVCWRMRKTNDNGFIMIGVKGYGSSILVVKTNENGNKEWSKTFGGSDLDIGYDIQQMNDGGYVVLGYTWSDEEYGDFGAILFKIDSQGDTEWYKLFNKKDYRSFQKTSDGGLVFTGYEQSLFYENEVEIMKTDINGDIIWVRKHGTLNNDWGHHVQQTTDEGYIIVGDTHPPPPKSWYDIIVIKTNERGRIANFITPLSFNRLQLIWTKLFQIQAQS